MIYKRKHYFTSVSATTVMFLCGNRRAFLGGKYSSNVLFATVKWSFNRYTKRGHKTSCRGWVTTSWISTVHGFCRFN